MNSIKFKTEKTLPNGLGRAGVISTPHGEIETPAFVVVGTKATVKSLTPEQVKATGAQAILANTYHLYLEPGDELVKKTGGLHQFMNYSGPLFTDSGGFQAFSLGAAFGKGISKFIGVNEDSARPDHENSFLGSVFAKPAVITEEGVTFYSHLDGSKHLLTPEKSMAIQHNLGADIMFAFDECTAPNAPYDYQKEAMERTHRWAKRSLEAHEKAGTNQGLFGIVQGGRHEDLRKESAGFMAELCPPAGGFSGFGIGGSYIKEDMDTAVRWVNEILPAEKPRHLLGVGEPIDLILGIENGVDTFDCVAPTRMARNGGLYTHTGKINILNKEYREDLSLIAKDCGCYTCQNYSRAYVAHLFRSKEMLAATLASIHNLYFIINLVKTARQAILANNFTEFKEQFIVGYQN